MKEIKKDDIVLARHIMGSDIKDGLNFFSQDSEFIQVGIWGNYECGKELQAHVHNTVERTINRTYEALYIMKGEIEAAVFDMDENLVDTIAVHQGEILILLECGHGYVIKKEGTTVLEIKNGPYLGADIDRHRINKEGI